MTHEDIQVGQFYMRRVEGVWCRVQITSLFDHPREWGYEGVLCAPESPHDQVPCWGWVSELAPQMLVTV